MTKTSCVARNNGQLKEVKDAKSGCKFTKNIQKFNDYEKNEKGGPEVLSVTVKSPTAVCY